MSQLDQNHPGISKLEAQIDTINGKKSEQTPQNNLLGANLPKLFYRSTLSIIVALSLNACNQVKTESSESDQLIRPLTGGVQKYDPDRRYQIPINTQIEYAPHLIDEIQNKLRQDPPTRELIIIPLQNTTDKDLRYNDRALDAIYRDKTNLEIFERKADSMNKRLILSAFSLKVQPEESIQTQVERIKDFMHKSGYTTVVASYVENKGSIYVVFDTELEPDDQHFQSIE